MQAWGTLIPALALGLAAGTATAADDLGSAVRSCRMEADAARRLACYDRVAETATGSGAPMVPVAPVTASAAHAAPAAAAVAAPAAPAAVAATPSARDNFGREHEAQAVEQKQRQQDARALGALEGTVTKIEQRADGLLTVTLDNGQIWRQNTIDSKFRLKEGDRVKIQAGSMNSYILSGPSKKSTRVSRVQ